MKPISLGHRAPTTTTSRRSTFNDDLDASYPSANSAEEIVRLSSLAAKRIDLSTLIKI